MTTEFMDGMYAVDPRPPAWLESFDKASSDPIVKAFGDYGKQGIPMPSIPEMAAVWFDGPRSRRVQDRRGEGDPGGDHGQGGRGDHQGKRERQVAAA